MVRSRSIRKDRPQPLVALRRPQPLRWLGWAPATKRLGGLETKFLRHSTWRLPIRFSANLWSAFQIVFSMRWLFQGRGCRLLVDLGELPVEDSRAECHVHVYRTGSGSSAAKQTPPHREWAGTLVGPCGDNRAAGPSIKASD